MRAVRANFWWVVTVAVLACCGIGLVMGVAGLVINATHRGDPEVCALVLQRAELPFHADPFVFDVSHNFYQNDPVVRSDLAGTCSKEYGEEVDPDVDSDLRSTVLVYRSESQAREALGKLAQDRAETMDQREGLAASLGDEAFAFHKQQNVGPWRISYCSVLWREGNTVGEVYFSASPAKAKMEVAEALARKVETRLK